MQLDASGVKLLIQVLDAIEPPSELVGLKFNHLGFSLYAFFPFDEALHLHLVEILFCPLLLNESTNDLDFLWV